MMTGSKHFATDENPKGLPLHLADILDGPVLPRSGSYNIRGLQGVIISDMGRAILAGDFPSGTMLPSEKELIGRYKASRSTVREALKVIAAKGLVEMVQRLGTRVRPQSDWNIFDTDVLSWMTTGSFEEKLLRDLLEFREVFEPHAARQAAVRGNAAAVSGIKSALDRMQANIHDLAAYAEADTDFHLAVLAASGNELMERLSHLLRAYLKLSFSIQQNALNADDNRIEDDLASHKTVYEAIALRKGGLAAKSMSAVIRNGKLSLVRALRQSSLARRGIASPKV